ncbi:MAG: MMPL family transporter [Treponema sp.]|jgi:predicted RND superfamily exporter protein|nr:MMPL family transporter [Treponema sp.]
MAQFFRHPWLILAVIAVITVFFAAQLPRAELDNNNLRFVPGDDPTLAMSRDIDDTFGSSLFILIGLERKYGTVFEREFLGLIDGFVRWVEEIPIVENVKAITNTDYITSSGGAIVVEKLAGKDFSGSPEEIAELKRRVLSWDMYERSLISDDFTSTQILVPLDVGSDDAGKPEVVANFIRIRNRAVEMFDGVAAVYVTGMPVISATINEAVTADLRLLVPLVIAVVLLVLFFSFRKFTAVVLPLLTVVIAVIWSTGAMPLFGVKLSVITTVLPVILVAVGSAYGIHVVTHYIAETDGRILDREEHRELVYELLRKIGRPVFLAALTTFAGFFSFCFTSVVPIREFGFFSSFGVFVSFAVALTLIPSLLIIRGPKSTGSLFRLRLEARGVKDAGGNEDGDPLSTVIAAGLMKAAGKKRFILGLAVLVTIVALYGLSKLVIDNVFVEYFRDDTDIYRSDVFIREKFGGSKVVSVVMEADDSAALLHPDSLAAMDGLGAYLSERVPQAGKVMDFTSLVKRINQVFNADESPDGLAAGISAGSTGAESAEGQDSFGFDNFGFDDFGFGGDDFGFGDSEQDGSGIEGKVPDQADRGKRVYTEEELLDLFDRAGGNSKSMNANDLVWELKRLVNYEGAAYYEIPCDPEKYGKKTKEELGRLISNYLVLLSGNIDEYANDPLEPTRIKSTVQLRTKGKYDSSIALAEIDGYVKTHFPPNIRVVTGGVTLVEFALNALVVQSQITSVIFSIIVVFIIISISNRSLVAGLVAVIPLSISILVNFAVMGFAGIKLNIGTSMVAGVSVGIGIDYTIHYIEAFKREYRAALAAGEQFGGRFLVRTFRTSGKAIIINAVSVGAGFAVLFLSRFVMLAHLGLLIALTMGTSALVSLTVIPVLLTTINPKFAGKGAGIDISC